MMKHRTLWILTALLLICTALLVGCTTPAEPTSATSDKPVTSEIPTHSGDESDETSELPGVHTTVTMNGDSVTVDGEGAAFDSAAKRISITKAGTYTFTGVLNDGQIYVNVAKEEMVALVMNGVKVSCGSSAPIYCDSSDKVYLIMGDGTTNTFEDAVTYVFADPADTTPNACIYSDDDLTIKGTGTLSVVGKFKNGISSKNDIKIKEATVIVNAVNTGIRGKDSVKISSGTVNVTCGKDAIKSTSTEEGRGYVLICGGEVNISAEDDGIQAENDITIDGCKVTVSSAGKAVNSAGTENVTEGCLIEK